VTNIDFSAGTDWQIHRPVEFSSGGWILSGGETDSLIFTIEETSNGTVGDYTIHALISGIENNTGRAVADNTHNREGTSIKMVNAALLHIIDVKNKAMNAPYVNVDQEFKIEVQIENDGGDEANNIELSLSPDGSSSLNTSVFQLPSLAGGEIKVTEFTVFASSNPTGFGGEIFYTQIRGYADNTGLLIEEGGTHDTTKAIIQAPALLHVTNVVASDDTIFGGQKDSWTVKVAVWNEGQAALIIDQPRSDDLTFSINGISQPDYGVQAPSSLLKSEGLLLSAGSLDTLIYTITNTGGFGGQARIQANISGKDKNTGNMLSHSNSTYVVIKSDPAFRIIKTKVDAIHKKGTEDGYVNTNQDFNIVVIIENGLGKTIGDIEVTLTTEGKSLISDSVKVISTLSPSVRIDSVRFNVTASTIETLSGETFFAKITQAKLNGIDLNAGNSLDSTAMVIIQTPAELSINLDLEAENGIVSTNQEFELKVRLTNKGSSEVDDSGIVDLENRPEGYQLIQSSESFKIIVDEEFGWKIRAPDEATDADYFYVRLENIPIEKNTGIKARIDTSSVRIMVTTISHFLTVQLLVDDPEGAKDGIISTEQDFTLKAVLKWNNVDNISAQITLPYGYSTTSDEQSIPDENGNSYNLFWKITAPKYSTNSDIIQINAAGVDSLQRQVPVIASKTDLSIETVFKTNLSLELVIISPDDAKDGKVSLGQEFEIEATVDNIGDADTSGVTKVTLKPLPKDYTTSHSNIKKLNYNGKASWLIEAPSKPTGETVNIQVEITTKPNDENTNKEAYVSRSTDSVPMTTEGAWLAVTVEDPGINSNNSIIPGQGWIKMMVIEFDNRVEDITGSLFINFLGFNVEDMFGNEIAPNRILSRVYVTDESDSTIKYGIKNQIGSSNPVEVQFNQKAEVQTDKNLKLSVYGWIIEGTEVDYFQLNILNGSFIGAVNDSDQEIPVKDQTQEELEDLRSSPKKVFRPDSEPILWNCPNPFGLDGESDTKISYYVEENTDIEFKIFTLLGELVWSYSIPASDSRAQAGQTHSIIWDGLNDHGYPVLNGVYYLFMITKNGVTAKTKVAVVR
jgi:hypothetical protein